MTNENTATVAEARTWLRDNGENVGTRGFLAADLKAKFEAATGKTIVSGK